MSERAKKISWKFSENYLSHTIPCMVYFTYIYQKSAFPNKSQPNVDKYTSPMDGMIIYIKVGGHHLTRSLKKHPHPTNGGGPPPSSSASRSHSGKVRFTTSLATAAWRVVVGGCLFQNILEKRTVAGLNLKKIAPLKGKGATSILRVQGLKLPRT